MKAFWFMVMSLALSALAYGQAHVEVRQNSAGYSVYVSFDGTVKQVISDFPREPTVQSLTNGVQAIDVSSGSSADYTYFVKTDTGDVDGPYFNVIKLNDRNLQVLYVGKGDVLTSKVLFSNSAPVTYHLPNLAPVFVVSEAITDVTFLPDNSIRVVYMTGSDYDKETIVLR